MKQCDEGILLVAAVALVVAVAQVAVACVVPVVGVVVIESTLGHPGKSVTDSKEQYGKK